ncbi:hypothetical protein PR002_g30586 [Phytophthora rubi]|uniref:HTH CENPB-type domain-containing protein n=1 Tax=Phytophthora rubi TaxID=129364 RepID=A0A6A3GQQ7_9STRA|nr:hypothetical protein PR002_g30586 [Phytophthora rubi]
MPSYTNDELLAAVRRVLAGEHAPTVSKQTRIHYRTLMNWVAKAKNGDPVAPSRRGPPPALHPEAEQNLVEWVIGRQYVGFPAKRQEIIQKASDIYAMMTGKTLGQGWYRRFLKRHPILSGRTSESITKARNSVSMTDATRLFTTLCKVLVEHKISSSRLFNMDETAFDTNKGGKRVVAVRGSRNVWHPDLSTGFHLTVVVCGSADGEVVPPLFILPGVTLKLDVLAGCDIPGATITTTSSGFMNTTLFVSWLHFFAASVPTPIKRPLVLLIDGCTSHYCVEVLEAAEKMGILLILFPANATHLLQPLDVAVFSTFKACIKRQADIYLGNGGGCSLSKEDAVSMASTAWKLSNLEANIKAGFRGCGLFPLNKLKMAERLDSFLRNGTPENTKLAEWLTIKATVQKEVLVLPPPRKRTRARKTVTVGGKLLTRETLATLASAKPTLTPKSKKRSKNAGCDIVLEAVV